jgi:hypothetical protein
MMHRKPSRPAPYPTPIDTQKSAKARDLCQLLGITTDSGYHNLVHVDTLYDIFMDEEKFKALASTLKLKAFW